MESDAQVAGNATVLYLEHGQLVGTRRQYCCGYARSDGTRTSAYWPCTAYVCPVCGELWGREILSYEFNYQPIPQNPWIVETRRCAQHGDGTLLAGFTTEAHLSCCSLDLLKREALLLCIRNPHYVP